MQTSNVHSLIGVPGVEAGKNPPSQPTRGNGFSALFSQLQHETSPAESGPEIDEPDSSETESPDETALTSEVKLQQPLTSKITARSRQELLEVSKKVSVTEVTPSDRSVAGTETTERLAGAENKNSSLPIHLLQAQDRVLEQAHRPANTKFQTQNLQQMAGAQQSNISINSKSQNTPALVPDAQDGDPQEHVSRQSFTTSQLGDKTNANSIQTGAQISTGRNGLQRSSPSFDQTKGVTLKPVSDVRTRFSATRLSEAQPAMTTPHNQPSPSASMAFHVAQISADIPETDTRPGDSINNFFPAEDAAEAELGRMNVMLSPSSATASEPTRAGTVRFAGTQMVDALIRQPNQPFEVALNPEELGRVRISLTHLDSGLSVAITAERPETLDLMRRHIEQLEAEFRQLGYKNIGFEFSDGDANSSDQTETKNQQSSKQMTDTSEPKTHSPEPVSTQTTGLDIRL